jgi:hypothetical protein
VETGALTRQHGGSLRTQLARDKDAFVRTPIFIALLVPLPVIDLGESLSSGLRSGYREFPDGLASVRRHITAAEVCGLPHHLASQFDGWLCAPRAHRIKVEPGSRA